MSFRTELVEKSSFPHFTMQQYLGKQLAREDLLTLFGTAALANHTTKSFNTQGLPITSKVTPSNNTKHLTGDVL